jgi:ribosome-binding factor A
MYEAPGVNPGPRRYRRRLSQTVARLRLSDSRRLKTLVTRTTQGITSFAECVASGGPYQQATLGLQSVAPRTRDPYRIIPDRQTESKRIAENWGGANLLVGRRIPEKPEIAPLVPIEWHDCTIPKRETSHMKSHRLARVSEVIREVASTTILFELKDPRVKGVTVTRVEVAGDLQHAKVYVSIMGSEKQQQLALYGLEHAAGYVQSKVAKQLATRFVPVIQFILDHGIKKSVEISRILAEERAKLKGCTVANDSVTDTDEGDEDAAAEEDDSAAVPPDRSGRSDTGSLERGAP